MVNFLVNLSQALSHIAQFFRNVLAQFVGLVKRDAELASALDALKNCLQDISEELRDMRERLGEVDKKIYHLENL